MLKTPILFLIFNRPEVTQKVFNEIKKARPTHLFVAADGARPQVEGEKEKCEETRRIIDQVDWDCTVHTQFSEVNLGCGRMVSGAISWFFSEVEGGIILEDDCLPSMSFFPYCEEMLERFKDDERVMMITGTNFLQEWKSDRQSYHFGVGGIWGWATWRRAWKYFDFEMKGWGTVEGKESVRNCPLLINDTQYKEVQSLLNQTYKLQGKVSWWSYQWMFVYCSQSGLSVVPAKNLISNIGYGPEATHTKTVSVYANITLGELEFPLKHPSYIVLDKEFEKKQYMMFLPSLPNRMYGSLRKLLSDIKKKVISK